MKFLLFLICAGAAVYFFCFKKPSDTSPAPEAAAAAPADAVKVPVKNKEVSQVADIKAKFSADAKFKKDSLGARLVELSNDTEFKFDPSWQIKISSTPVSRISQELKRYPQTLPKARDLQKYDDWGMEEVYILSALKHMNGLQTAVRVLTFSGILNASKGNTKQAVADFNAASKILNVFLEGSHCWAEIYSCKNHVLRLRKAVNSSRLSAKKKQEILRGIPDKKDWAKAFPRLLENIKEFGLQTKTFADAGADMKSLFGNDASNWEVLKQISRDRWEEMLNKSQEFIRSEWENGTLSQDTKINVGTEQENILLRETFVVQGFIRFLK